ncbi:hypothetical protein GCM10027568_20710 [Humibacter soli]
MQCLVDLDPTDDHIRRASEKRLGHSIDPGERHLDIVIREEHDPPTRRGDACIARPRETGTWLGDHARLRRDLACRGRGVVGGAVVDNDQFCGGGSAAYRRGNSRQMCAKMGCPVPSADDDRYLDRRSHLDSTRSLADPTKAQANENAATFGYATSERNPCRHTA